MKEERRKKAQSLCAQEIGEYILGVQDSYITTFGIITLTKICISPDSSYMDVFVSCQKNTETLTKALASHASNITRIMAKKIAFFKIPKVRFRYDHSGETSANIYTTIAEVSWNE